MAAAGRRGREGGGKVGGLGANGSRCLPASRRALAAHAPRSNASAVAAAFEATKAEVGSGLPVPFPSLPPSLVTRGHLSSEDVRSKEGRKEGRKGRECRVSVLCSQDVVVRFLIMKQSSARALRSSRCLHFCHQETRRGANPETLDIGRWP